MMIANERLVLTLPGGEQYRFHDFDQPGFPQGPFANHVTGGGQLTEVTSYTGDERIEEMQRTATMGGSSVTQSFRYSYNSSP